MNTQQAHSIFAEQISQELISELTGENIDYLDSLGWGEYLVPEITNFIDDDGNLVAYFDLQFAEDGNTALTL